MAANYEKRDSARLLLVYYKAKKDTMGVEEVRTGRFFCFSSLSGGTGVAETCTYICGCVSLVINRVVFVIAAGMSA